MDHKGQNYFTVVFFRQQIDVIVGNSASDEVNTTKSISSPEPNHHLVTTSNHLSLYYNNIRGMTGKKDQILLSTTSCDYDIIVLSETWLCINKFSGEFFHIRYTVYRKDRADSGIDTDRGGGVLIAVDSKIDSEIVVIPELESLEAICVKLNLNSSRILIYGLYIQHGSTEEVYSAHLSAIIKAYSVLQHGDIFLVTGDFNMPAIQWVANEDGFDFLPFIGDSVSIQSNIARTFTSKLLECGLFQLTDAKNKYGNVLDLVYTNMPELSLATPADLPIIRDDQQDEAHIPLHCMIECEPMFCPPSISSEKIYCFKKARFDLIREAIANINFEALLADKNINEMVDTFYTACYALLFVSRIIPFGTTIN